MSHPTPRGQTLRCLGHMERLRCSLRTALRSNELSFAFISFLWKLRDALQPLLKKFAAFLVTRRSVCQSHQFRHVFFHPLFPISAAHQAFVLPCGRGARPCGANPLRTGGGHASLTSACAFRVTAACPSLWTPHGRRRYGSPFWGFFNLYAILPDAKTSRDRDSFPCPSYARRCLHAWTQVSISFAVCCSTVCRRVVTAATFPSSATFIVPCVNSAVSRSLSITVKNQMCGPLRVLVDGCSWIRERLDVAACIIPLMIRLLLRRVKVQHIAASMSLRRDWSCTYGSRLCSSASVQTVFERPPAINAQT